MPSRPDVLTAEIVIKDCGPMLHKLIRSFHIPDTEPDDLFNDIILAFITPSRKLGTSFLERYSPSRGAVTTYLYMHAHHILKSQYRKSAKRAKMAPAKVGGKAGVAEWYRDNQIGEKLGSEEREVYHDLERHEIIKALKPHGTLSQKVGTARRRSTRRIGLHVLKGHSVPEVSESTGMSAVAVRRRLRTLRNDGTFRALAADRGMKVG